MNILVLFKGKGTGSMNNLLESSSLEDGLDSDPSVTPSPVPSLNEVLRSNGKLEPGLPGKPPIPPVGLVSRREHKSLDDIINIKFQRWFPEAIQDTYADSINELTGSKSQSNDYGESNIKTSKSTENLCEIRNSSRTPETQVTINYPMQFEAYESPRLDSAKKLPRTHTMETILETDDHSSLDKASKARSASQYSPTKESEDFLKSKVGQSLNKYLISTEGNSQKKKVTIDDNRENNIKKNCDPRGECSNETRSKELDNHQHPEDIKLANRDLDTKYQDRNGSHENLEPQVIGEPYRTGLNNDDILSWMGNSSMVSKNVYPFTLGQSNSNKVKCIVKIKKQKKPVRSL